MRYQGILYEKHENIACVVLNRPDASNKLDSRLAVELREVCREIDDDEELRAAILTGNGDAFSLGAELMSGSAPVELLNGLVNAVDAVASLELPVIAAVNGPALGEGLELALACDIRIASESAEFGLPQIIRGHIPMCGGTQRLPRIIGKGKAVEMILTGETIGAEEAYRVGLVNKVVSKEKVMATAEELAKRIARNAPIATRYAKEAILKGLDKPLGQGLRLEMDLSVLLQTTEDRAEGIQSFLERRTPKFRGK